MTEVELDLFTDLDMHLFIEEGIHRGVAIITHCHAKINVPDLKGYDPTKPNEYIVYLDANNLYGWTMSQSLLTGNFKLLDQIDHFDVASIREDNDTGYFLEVDLGMYVIFMLIYDLNKYMCSMLFLNFNRC